jgi:hypothetical protein
MRTGRQPQVYDDLFSGVDLVPTLLELLGLDVPADVDGMSHAGVLARRQQHAHPCAPRSTRRRLPRLLRPDPRDPDEGVQLHRELRARPLLDLPWDIADSAPGSAVWTAR